MRQYSGCVGPATPESVADTWIYDWMRFEEFLPNHGRIEIVSAASIKRGSEDVTAHVDTWSQYFDQSGSDYYKWVQESPVSLQRCVADFGGTPDTLLVRADPGSGFGPWRNRPD